MLGFHKQIMGTDTVMNPVPSLTVFACIYTVTCVTHVGGMMFLGARYQAEHVCDTYPLT